MLADFQCVCGNKSVIVVNLQLKSIRQKCLEHGPRRFQSRSFGHFGDYIERIVFQPVWAAHNLFGIDSIGRFNQVDHCRVADFVTAAAKSRTSHEWIADGRTHVDVRNFKDRFGFGGLAIRQTRKEGHAAYEPSRHKSSPLLTNEMHFLTMRFLFWFRSKEPNSVSY